MGKQLRVGIAKGKLTPQVPVELGGFAARTEPCSGVLDDIWVRSIFLTDGAQQLAIVSVEVIGLTPEHVTKLKEQIKHHCGLEESQILIAATHTHSAPIIDNRLIGCGKVNPEYAEFFDSMVVKTCCESMKRIIPCTMYLATGRAPDVSYNRRILLENGVVTLDEEVDESSVVRFRPVDDSLQTITMIDSEGVRIAKLVHFACHGVCMGPENTKVSSDLPGWVCRHIEDRRGAQCCIFLNGAAGDINPIRKCAGFESLRRNGNRLLNSIEQLERLNMKLMDQQTIETKLWPVEWPFKAAYDIEGFENLLSSDKTDISDPTSGECWSNHREVLVQWAQSSIEKLKNGHFTASAVMHDITIGTQRMVGLPFEVFSDIPKLITRSLQQPISVIGLANGVLGYFPDPEEVKLGGYEVTVSPVFYNQIGCLDPVEALRLIESALLK